ncbi:MAG TPA: PilW family protein [bacterium]
MKKGMTLVELMVSLVVLSFVLVAIFSLLSIQQVRSTQVVKGTVLQTDAQVTFTLFKWDMMMTGMGYPYGDASVVTGGDGTGGLAGSDVYTTKAAALGFETGTTHWGYVLDLVYSGSQIIDVRRWDNTKYDFVAGDHIILLNQQRYPLYTDLIIQSVTPFLYFMPNGDTVHANHLIFTSTFPKDIPDGLAVFQYNPTLLAGTTYQINAQQQLMRGNEVLLDNVEDLQFAYGIDNDNDGVVETWSNTVPSNPSFTRKWAIRFNMVIASEGMGGYQYPSANYTIENHLTNLTQVQRRMRRIFVSNIVYPQNLEP